MGKQGGDGSMFTTEKGVGMQRVISGFTAVRVGDSEASNIVDVLRVAARKAVNARIGETTEFTLVIDLTARRQEFETSRSAAIEALRARKDTKESTGLVTRLVKGITGKSLSTDDAIRQLTAFPISGSIQTTRFDLGVLLDKINAAVPSTGRGRKSKTMRSKFDRCVKSVKKTVKARKGSSKESAAIGICTTSVLHPRGRTIKRYRKGRLTTQKKFRGGEETF